MHTTCMQCLQRAEQGTDPMELYLQMVVNLLLVLAMESQSSTRAASPLNCEAMSSGHDYTFFKSGGVWITQISLNIENVLLKDTAGKKN